MKTKLSNTTLLMAMGSLLALTGLAQAADSNFQIAPPPIPYPVFVAGATDSKIEPIVVSISAPSVTLSGGGVNADGRYAFSDMLAVDVQGGLFALTGEMPGIPPMSLLPAYSSSGSFLGYYTPQTTGKATVSMTSIQMSMNVEFQAIRGAAGGLIIFAGPSFGVMNMEMKTPYRLYWPATGATYSGYTDTLTISATNAGFQMGLQGDIALIDDMRIVPFMMVGSFSGTSTLTDKPGMSRASGTTSTADIPSYSTSSMGMDIIMGNLSIGTLMQQMQSQDQASDPVKITMFRLGFRF
jgi:hypothetical protein